MMIQIHPTKEIARVEITQESDVHRPAQAFYLRLFS